MSSGKLTTNLGNQAQTTRLLADAISATDYQKPFQQYGTLFIPNVPTAIFNAPYVPGINKYIVFIQTSATGVAINQEIVLQGLPFDYPATHSVSGTVEWICLGTTALVTVAPILFTTLSVRDDNVAPNQGTIYLLNANSFSPATFSGGTAVLKMVISINLD